MKTSHAILGDAEQLITELAEASTDELTIMRAELDAGFGEVGNSLNNAKQALTKQAANVGKVTQVYIAENPWRALGAVAAAGIVIGLLLSRR